MAGWSSLGKIIFGQSLLKSNIQKPFIINNVKLSLSSALKSDHGPKIMAIQPSRWQWHKFKDMLHMYVMVGLIPCSLVVLYCNIYIGPAELTPIPKDYVPKHWEYHQHPITRFIARYIYNDPQQDYEKFMHYIYEENEKGKLRLLEKRIKAKMNERQDYQAFYYTPMSARYLRAYKRASDDMGARMGDQ